MAATEEVGIGLLGLGVVGGGVARVLTQKRQELAAEAGCPLVLRKALVRHLDKGRSVSLTSDLLTTNPAEVLDDPRIDIIVEVMGGESPAQDYICRALSQGKSVVTANKEVIAKHAPRLLALAREHGVGLSFEASVGGGIPLVAPFQQDLAANRLSALQAIINGTTNYILTRMDREGLEFDVALGEAQRLGYAEPDPTNDVEGIDAAYKLAILASLAFHTQVRVEDVYREGITRLANRDFRYARELGYAIKLLAIAKESQGTVEARVHPTFIPQERLMAKVDGVFNAVQVEGDLVGRVIFYGEGAGPSPTSSAVTADLIRLAQSIHRGKDLAPRLSLEPIKPIRPISQIRTRYYLRMTVADRAGVLAQISKTLGDNNISIASVVQKETDELAQAAEIVIMTHLAQEAAMQQALQEMARLPVVHEVSNFVRVET
ncbi:MAG TPA: homoserine dehydrogenase [Dehalococcoidia bacterium]|nr:homoserine dehydrogenase [Dehalococcoidia bacterium]